MGFLDRFNSGVNRIMNTVGDTVTLIFVVLIIVFFSALFLAALVAGVWGGWALGNASTVWALAYIVATWFAFALVYDQYVEFIGDLWNVRLPEAVTKAHLFIATIYTGVVAIAWLIG